MRKEGSRGKMIKKKIQEQLSCCGMKGRNASICSVVGRKLTKLYPFIPFPIFPVTTLEENVYSGESSAILTAFEFH